MGIFPWSSLRLLRALPAVNLVSVLWFELFCRFSDSRADQLVLLVTDCLIILEAELVSDMEHPFCVHVYMKNKVVDPHDELKKGNQRGSLGWDVWEMMSASTLKPLTKTSHGGIWSMKVRWMRSCAARQSLWLHLTHHQENQDWTVT